MTLFWVLAGLFLLVLFLIGTNFMGIHHGGEHRWPKGRGLRP